MLDFRQASKPRYTWNRRQQLLALVVVVTLGLVVGLLHDWGAVYRLLRSLAAQDQQAGEGGRRGSFVDTRVAPRSTENDPPDAFVSPLTPDEKPDQAPPGRYFRGVMSNYLQSVRDDRPFVHDEKDAWFNLLDILNKTELKTLKKASTGRVTFVQLYRQSDDYRGELITVRGVVRWVHRVTAPKNDYGIQSYYQVWLTPDDNPDNLEVVYSLRLPQDFPTGKNLAEDVEVTGFYFKRWVYRATDTLRTAPVILAQILERQKRPVLAKETDGSLATIVAIVVGTSLFALLFAVFVYWRTRPQRRVAEEGAADVRIAIAEPDPSEDTGGSGTCHP